MPAKKFLQSCRITIYRYIRGIGTIRVRIAEAQSPLKFIIMHDVAHPEPP
jgi:hypothetical protein